MAHVVPAAAGSAPPRPTRRSKTGYLLLFPGIAWLAVFFAIPLVTLFATSLQVPIEGKTGKYKPGLDFSNYSQALADYWPQFLRSFMYAGLATLLALVIAPSFASFLLRTYAWKTILADDGFVTSTLNTLHLLPEGRILNTWIAVVAGLTYNFLPFMVLPLYAALERIDHRFIEAAGDLYASPQTAFRKVTWPLSMPGVVAGTLLTFIPAAGDYINSELLGSPRNRMIGNEIQANFIEYRDYPAASAMSFMLMAVILVLVFVYIRRAGTEDLV